MAHPCRDGLVRKEVFLTTKRSFLADWKVWFGVVVSAGAMYWAFKDVDPREVADAIGKMNGARMIPALIPIILAMILRGWRWRFFIRDDRSSLRLRYNALNIGVLGTSVLPLRLGEFLRAYVYAVKERRRVVEIFSTVAAERVFDVITLFILLIATLPFVPTEGLSAMISKKFGVPELARRELMAVSAAVAVGLFAGFLIFCRIGRPIARSLRDRFRIGGGRIESLAKSILDGIEAPVASGRLGLILVVSAVCWSLFGVAYYIAALAFPVGDTSLAGVIGLAGAVYLECIICIAIAIPSAPGFFGVWHAGALFAFAPYMNAFPELTRPTILAYAIVAHLLGFLVSIAMGFESLYNEGMSFRRIREVAHEKNPGAGLPGEPPKAGVA